MFQTPPPGCPRLMKQMFERIGVVGVRVRGQDLQAGSDELQNFEAGEGCNLPRFFVNVATKEDKVEWNQQLRMCWF